MQLRKAVILGIGAVLLASAATGVAVKRDHISDYVNETFIDKYHESHYFAISTRDIRLYTDRNLDQSAGTLPKVHAFEKLGHTNDSFKITVNGVEYWIRRPSPVIGFSEESGQRYYHGDVYQFLGSIIQNGGNLLYDEYNSAQEALAQIGTPESLDTLVSTYSVKQYHSSSDSIGVLRKIASLDSSHKYRDFLTIEVFKAMRCSDGPPTGESCYSYDSVELLVNYVNNNDEMESLARVFYDTLISNVPRDPGCGERFYSMRGLDILYSKGYTQAGNYLKQARDKLYDFTYDFGTPCYLLSWVNNTIDVEGIR